MSERGVGRGRARGPGRGRGRGRGRGTTVWSYDVGYKPGPEVYDNLYRLRKAPPLITQTLPDACPIPNAQSRILSRRTTEDEYSRNYYIVQIKHLPHEGKSDGDEDGVDELAHVDCSRILECVSRKELSRFEGAEARAESEAIAAAQRADAEEKARRVLKKNARAPGMGRGMWRGQGRGSGLLNGLAPLEPAAVGRGRPRGSRGRSRGTGRGRGRGRGRFLTSQPTNGMIEDMEMEDMADEDPSETIHLDEEDLQRIIAESEDELELEDEDLPSKSASPNLARSSFIANSALPVSPILAHRRLSKSLLLRHEVSDVDDVDEVDKDGDSMSTTSGAVPPRFQGDARGRRRYTSSENEDRHLAKRQRTESTSTSRRPPTLAPSSMKSSLLQRSVPNDPVARAVESSEEPSSSEEDDTIVVQQDHAAQPVEKNASHRLPPDRQDGNPDDDDDPESDAEEWAVEAIVDHSFEGRVKYYLVRWQGYEDSSDWVSATDMAGAPELVAEYEAKVKRKTGQSRMAMR